MENGFLHRLSRFPAGDKLQFRKRLLIFGFFLMLSVIIWFLNALAKNYTTFIDYPVEYSNFPKDRVLIGELPDQLNLRVDAHGYALLRYKLIARPEPIVFNVSSFAMSRIGNDTARSYILTRFVRDQVSRQLPSELQLLDIKPDSLQFQFARSASRTVEIKPNLKFSVDKQFTIKDRVNLSPDSARISGPDFMIDTISAVYTSFMDLGLLSKSYEGVAGITAIEFIDISVKEVKCLIELERFTEVNFYVPVDVLNLPDSLGMQTFPSRIKVTCNVGLSQYNRIDQNLFRATVDYAGIEDGSKRLPVKVMNIPVYVRSFDYNPQTVEFLLSSK